MQFRMLVLEKAAQKSGRPLRQMFVTQSRMLANRVQQYWDKLQQKEGDTEEASRRKLPSFSFLDLDEDAEEDVLPPKFSQLNDSHFPLFLTYNQVSSICSRNAWNSEIVFAHSFVNYLKPITTFNSILQSTLQ